MLTDVTALLAAHWFASSSTGNAVGKTYCHIHGFNVLSISLNARRTCALGPAVLNKHWAPMAADHSARGSMKTGVKPETVCELQDTNDHRQVERKWRLPISVGKLSALEGRLINLHQSAAVDVRHAVNRPTHVVSAVRRYMASSQVPILASSNLHTRWRPCPDSMRQRRVRVDRHTHIFDLGGAGSRTELKHIIKCRKRNQMGFPQ